MVMSKVQARYIISENNLFRVMNVYFIIKKA